MSKLNYTWVIHKIDGNKVYTYDSAYVIADVWENGAIYIHVREPYNAHIGYVCANTEVGMVEVEDLAEWLE